MATDLQIAARKLASVNPATGEVLRELECAGEGDVHAAVSRAQVAQAACKALSIHAQIEEQIFHAAGARTETEQKIPELVRFVGEAGRIPVQRDTLYNEVRRWDE